MSHSLPNSAIIAILAGGKAKRFGGKDKGEILIGGQRLIDIIHERLKTQSTEIIISGTYDYGFGSEVIPDVPDAPGGPAGGIYSIWKALTETDAKGFYTVAVDGPNLPHDLTDRLYSHETSTIATDETGRHPTYGWWRMVDLAHIWGDLDISQSLSLNRLADLIGAKQVKWDGDKSFININRPDDLEEFVKGT